MNESEFNRRVAELRADPIPPCPANLESNVLRRIRLAQDEPAGGWDWLWTWMPRPAFAAATLAVMLASSLATSAIAMNAQREQRAAEARAALGFDAFSGPLQLPTDHR